MCRTTRHVSTSKYNHADSKVTYLASLSRCHEYILNESLISSLSLMKVHWTPSQPMWANDISFEFEFLQNCFSNLYWSMVRSLRMLYIYNYIFIKNLIFHDYCCIKSRYSQVILSFTILYIYATFPSIFSLWFLIP